MRIALAVALFPALLAAPADGRPQLASPALAGRYAYRDKELAASLDLRADRTFRYQVESVGKPVTGEEPLHLLMQGVWRLAGGNIVLTSAPTSPPVLQQLSATRDPQVRAALTVVTADGRPVEDLGVLTDGGANGQLNMLADGGWIIPLLHPWNTDDGDKGTPTRLPRSWKIVRSGDDLALATITLSPGGPNRFAFRYTPSPIEPFALAAVPVPGEPGALDVELGTASVRMRKITR